MMDLKQQRTKIYSGGGTGTSAHPSAAKKNSGATGAGPASPKQTTLPTPPFTHTAASGKHLDITETALWHEHERVKGVLKERELKYLKVREENAVLKQIERRHQRELAELEAKNEDAPRIIRGLREEVQGLKNKLKDSYAFQGTQDRRIRLLAEQLDQAKQMNAHLQSLVEQQDLQMRAELQAEIDQCRNGKAEQEEICTEMRHKCDLLEKNFVTESLNLRMKIRALENENQLFKDKIEMQENSLRERDRDLASLSIYKYNALHRKPDPCKVCQKRQLEARELKRRQDILAALPRPPKPQASVVSAHSIRVRLALPPLTATCHYDRVQLSCSAREDMSHARVFNVEPGKPLDMVVDNLPVGRFCFLRAVAFSSEFASEPSDHETVFVDVLPSTPAAPTVSFQCTPQASSITVTVAAPVPGSGGTVPRTVRLYQSLNGSTFYLAAELALPAPATPAAPTADGQPAPPSPPRTVTHTFKNPELAVKHWFAASLVNELGESPRSGTAGPVVLDFPPGRPAAPQVKRFGASSVQVALPSPPMTGQSSVSRYRVWYHDVTQADQVRSVEVAGHPASAVVESLEVGQSYVFAVAAGNAAGWSETSRYSEPVCLEDLLPIPPAPQCIILSPTTVRCLLYSSHRPDDHVPPCTGYKLFMARTHDLSDLTVVCPFVPVTPNMPSEYLLERLDVGGSYWLAVSLLGPEQESGMSVPVWVCLAAAIPLPITPRPATPKSSPAPPPQPSAPPPPATLNRATSRSIDLSVAQRIQNLFRGNPAFAIPDDVRAQAEADGVQVVVTNGYTSPTALRGSHHGHHGGGGGGGHHGRSSVESLGGSGNGGYGSRRDLVGGGGSLANMAGGGGGGAGGGHGHGGAPGGQSGLMAGLEAGMSPTGSMVTPGGGPGGLLAGGGGAGGNPSARNSGGLGVPGSADRRRVSVAPPMLPGSLGGRRGQGGAGGNTAAASMRRSSRMNLRDMGHG
ncbi:hypothetical protein H9P43_001077 [Blastocladiella emersonii ATCC 22665]|nr:hypothetical protein H9P43_001077 [Blastocladiella emersonii ATCC 22665]